MNDKGRMIFDEAFLEDIDNGVFANLFNYLKNHKNEYILALRNNSFTLYCHGRKTIIKRTKKGYIISFEMNNANLMVVRNPEKLDSIIGTLKKLNFDVSKYESWKTHRCNYLNMPRSEKSKSKIAGMPPSWNILALVPFKDMYTYDFALLLDTIYPIFRSYRLKRSEENFKQACLAYYTSFQNDFLVFDSEYIPSFEKKENKELFKTLCQTNLAGSCQFIKPDLVALQKCGEVYRVIFIELKINIQASTGSKANIVDHVIDWQNYCTLYKENATEMKNLAQSVEFILRFLKKHELLECDDIENVLAKTDFSLPPKLKIVCGLNEESEEQFIEKMKDFMIENCLTTWDNWNTEIVVGNDTPEILAEPGLPLNEYLKRGRPQGHYDLPAIKRDILEIAPIYLDEDYDEEAKNRLKRELAMLSSHKLSLPLSIINELAMKIDSFAYPIVYEGLLADSLIAYVLSLTMEYPSKEKYSSFRLDTGTFYVPEGIIDNLVDHATKTYGEDITIQKIEHGYCLMYYGYNIKIELIEREIPKLKLI